MVVTVTLPDELANSLQTKAEAQQVSLDELVSDLLISVLETEMENYPTLEEVIAKIKATPPNPANVHPASKPLIDLLRNAPEDPNFDVETWTRDWTRIEAEMKAADRANDVAEGRGW